MWLVRVFSNLIEINSRVVIFIFRSDVYMEIPVMCKDEYLSYVIILLNCQEFFVNLLHQKTKVCSMKSILSF